jgi:hypothetical protein
MKEVKTRTVSFRLTESSYKVLEDKIRQAYNLSSHYSARKKLGDFMRQSIFKSKVTDMGQLLDSMSLLRTEINRIGVNVNQIAKQANNNGYNDKLAEEFSCLLDEAKKALSSIVRSKNE